MSQRVALDLADFLDSSAATALAAPRREDVRAIAERFLEVCYDELGKAPRFLDGHDLHEALVHLLPRRFGRKDPLAEHVPAVLEVYFAHLETAQVVAQVFEIQSSLAATLPEFLEVVRTGRHAHEHAPRQPPIVHTVAKTGRNDPCFCGSGKKFKKCHGQSS